MNPHVISRLDVNPIIPEYDPDDQQFELKILAEGDSWFSLRGIPTSNLLNTLEFEVKTIVVSCAKPGDTIRKMSQMKKSDGFKTMTSSKLGYEWDAILLSGGGNDIINKARKIIKSASNASSNPETYCNTSVLQDTLDKITNGYEQLVRWRDRTDSICPECPIITHTYDYPTPRNSPSRFFGLKLKGPWLYKALINADVPRDMWIPVTDHLMDRLAETIQDLGDRLTNFNVVNTLGTLDRAELDTTLFSGDWADEIHPNMKGYVKLSEELAALI